MQNRAVRKVFKKLDTRQSKSFNHEVLDYDERFLFKFMSINTLFLKLANSFKNCKLLHYSVGLGINIVTQPVAGFRHVVCFHAK